MTKKKLSKALSAFSDELHKEYLDSYNQDLRSGHYRDLLSEVLDRIDWLEAQTRKRWWSNGYKKPYKGN